MPFFLSHIVVFRLRPNLYKLVLRTTFYIRIGAENFYIATKEGQNIECRRDDEMLTYTIDMLVTFDLDEESRILDCFDCKLQGFRFRPEEKV